MGKIKEEYAYDGAYVCVGCVGVGVGVGGDMGGERWSRKVFSRSFSSQQETEDHQGRKSEQEGRKKKGRRPGAQGWLGKIQRGGQGRTWFEILILLCTLDNARFGGGGGGGDVALVRDFYRLSIAMVLDSGIQLYDTW